MSPVLHRTRIKICGLTREEDVRAAVAAGADAIGFVFYPPSPRYVSFERAAELHPDIVFGKVDTEAEQQLAAEFRITSIPTLMIFRDGIMVYTQPGALPATQLDQLIQGARDLDMNDVRRQIAERDAQPAS